MGTCKLKDSIKVTNGSTVGVIRCLAIVGFLLVADSVWSADRLVVRHSKEATSAESGLNYEFTFRVLVRRGDSERLVSVDDAEFIIATDMPDMPGAHHMPHVNGEPSSIPGTYTALLAFDMPGEWNLILKFNKPIRDQVVISEMIHKSSRGDSQHPHDSNH